MRETEMERRSVRGNDCVWNQHKVSLSRTARIIIDKTKRMEVLGEIDVSQTVEKTVSLGRQTLSRTRDRWRTRRGCCDVGQDSEGRRVGESGFRIVAIKKCTTSRLDPARGKDIVYNCSDTRPSFTQQHRMLRANQCKDAAPG